MTRENNHAGRAWYALRRTLPPWNVDENLAELVEFCSHNHVDEVIAKVDTEEFSHGIPAIEWLDDYLPVLHLMKAELGRIGVLFSINPWVTPVHCDRGRDIHSTYPDIVRMVGHDGAQCKVCACPLSEAWRRITCELWRRYASLHPDVLWVEDDIRLTNHSPAEYGCFCELHIDKFAEREGMRVPREELVSAILDPGEPHPFRKAWLDLNRDTMVEVAHMLEQCVHEVSPETKLGLMCSVPTFTHAVEGRDWKSFTSALAGKQPLVARPCMCAYSEVSPRDIYESEYYVRSTLYCLEPNTIIQTELDNFPFSTYSKSTRFTFLQMALSFVLGADGVTMNLFDHLGTPMSVNPEFGELLRKEKPFLNGLASRCQGGKAAGVRLLHAPDGSYHVRLRESAAYSELSPEGHGWRHVLEPLGFPITFEDSDVVALTGQVVRGLPSDLIREILSKGVMLDLTALDCLTDMGYGDLLGAVIGRVFHKHSEPLSAEEYFNAQWGGSAGKYMTLSSIYRDGDAVLAEIEPSSDAQVISRVVDPDTRPLYPLLTVFENALGGRVAVYPIDLERTISAAFLNPYRKQQFEEVIGWLAKDRVPMLVRGGAYPLPFRADHDGYSVIGAFNLSLDDYPRISFDMDTAGHTPHRIESIADDGAWRDEQAAVWTPTANGISVQVNKPIPALSLVALTLWWGYE